MKPKMQKVFFNMYYVCRKI